LRIFIGISFCENGIGGMVVASGSIFELDALFQNDQYSNSNASGDYSCQGGYAGIIDAEDCPGGGYDRADELRTTTTLAAAENTNACCQADEGEDSQNNQGKKE